MADLKGTRVYWRPASNGSATTPRQILKNSGYINVVLQAVQYKARGNFWQRLFGGKDKITVSTQVVWQSTGDSKTAAAIQDFRKIAVPSTNALAIGRNVVLKVPAEADGIELQVSIGAVQDDNLGRTLQFLNSDDFKQPLQLAPVAVGQALTIASLVKKVFTDTDPADVLTASYPGIISSDAMNDPVANNRLVEGYIILIVKQDDDDQLDFDQTKLSVTGNGLLADGTSVPNTYMVYNVSFDPWRGRDVSASWSKKFDQASTKADELMFATPDQRQSIVTAAFDLLKAGSALLDDDVNYITAEKTNLKKAAILEVQGKINANAAPATGRAARPRSLTATASSLGITAVPGNLDFAETDVHDDVMAYANQLAASGLALGFNVRLDTSRALPSTPATRVMAPPIVREFSPTDLAALRPYVVSMRRGQWDTTGILNTSKSDVQALFFQYADAALKKLPAGKKLKFIVYAHGGLVAEDHGLAQAQAHINWLKRSADEGVYPLYFVWKTGLGETIAQLLGLASPSARQLATREFITDPIIAALARALGGETIWSEMKQDAEQAVLAGGVATFVAQQMKAFCDLHPNRVELHAAGHSAGAVFHAHYIPASTAAGNLPFKTTSFMAPAVRVDTFFDQLTRDDGAGNRTLKPEVGDLAILTMKKDFELRDDCDGIYRQSLLYLIYHAFEPQDKTPILGLEESIRADAHLVRLLGLGGTASSHAEAIWSPTDLADGPSASRAIHHGDFSNDAPSLDSILCRILAVSNLPASRKYLASRGLDDIWNIWSKTTPPVGVAPAAPQPSPVLPVNNTSGTGRRRALCVGINTYASPNQLSGCVRDADAWANTLKNLGFETQMLVDAQATHGALTTALRDLVLAGRNGDVIVFQYSGHGTVVPDDTGRTIDGQDEAMVPVDFSVANPNLLLDTEVKSIFDQLPSGVNLTCFIDCCHSGTDTRAFAVELSHLKARRIVLSAAEAAAVRNQHQYLLSEARGIAVGGQERMRDIAFAACLDSELAYESSAGGEFTQRAISILSKGIAGVTNDAFAAAVLAAFGASPVQHPQLDCPSQARSQDLLEPEDPAAAPLS